MNAGGMNLATASPGAAGVDLCRWVDSASCADRGDLPWITDAHQVSTLDRDAMAAVCAGCPVLASCAGAAERLEVRAAYWAGQHRDTLAPVPVQWVAHTSTRTPRSAAASAREWEQGALAWPDLGGAA